MRRFTVAEYHQLIQLGVLTENDRVELLEGWLVHKMPHNPPHDGTIQVANESLIGRLPAGWKTRIQSSITTADSEPEPDITVVRGDARTYLLRHPGPSDIGTLIEVADSTLHLDRGDKARLYARAGIVIYWIINLVDRQVEVYTDPTGPDAAPRYRQRQDYPETASVPLVLDGQQLTLIPVRDLLP
ncbi:MAG: Uma2 family endonuclease [Planctomycetia bacterium]|nr:Uma2 family endonuclease [Planctomycetia bacterium]